MDISTWLPHIEHLIVGKNVDSRGSSMVAEGLCEHKTRLSTQIDISDKQMPEVSSVKKKKGTVLWFVEGTKGHAIFEPPVCLMCKVVHKTWGPRILSSLQN